ncbi:hypothetical protein Tco_1262266 [Tanacetum coccineum]
MRTTGASRWNLGWRSCDAKGVTLEGLVRFWEEGKPVEIVEILGREIKSLKRSKIPLVKIRWDSKHGPEFTWECEDYMKSKYPQLFADRDDESVSFIVPLLLRFKLGMEMMLVWKCFDYRDNVVKVMHGLYVAIICYVLHVCDVIRSMASDQLEWVLWYAPWLSDQLEWNCGMLHGLVINWSSSAKEMSRDL